MFTSLFRAEEDRSPGSDFWFQPVGLRTSSGAMVTTDTAMRHSAVYACVRVHAESMAVLPFRLYRRKKGGRGRELVTDHWLYQRFARRPNRYQTPFAWREMLQGHLSLRGNAYCEIIEGPRGEIAELLPLHPDRVKIELLDNGSWRYRHTNAAGSERVLRRDQVWHLRGLMDDGIVGLNPIEMNREAVGGAIAAAQYANRFWANDAKPTSGWIEFPGKFDTTEAKRSFRAGLQAQQSGANRHKTMVLDMGMKYHEVGISNKDSQFIEARQFSVGDIARIFRTPPHKIGDLSRSTNNNIEHQSLEFWTDTMLPWTERWESSIECDLLGDEDEELEVEFDYRRLLRGDSTSRGAYLRAMVLSGIFTPNEARDEEGKNPLEGLDEPLIPTNMAVLGDEPGTAAPAPAPKPPTDSKPADDDEGEGSPDARTANAAAQPVPVIARASERVLALAGAAAERVARKELHEVTRAYRAADSAAALQAAYEGHAAFVAAALGVGPDQAAAYCAAQLAGLDAKQSPESFTFLATQRLQRLALTGVHTE